jgi:signal peptidase II
MQKANRPQGKLRLVVLVSVVALVIIVDQVTKWWIRTGLDIGEVLTDAGFFRIIRIQNTGAAFGIFQGHSQILIIVVFVGIVALLVLTYFLHRRWAFLDSMLLRVAMGLVLGGTIGNQIDRLLHDGHVTDFLDFKVWPIFNVADASTTVGVIIAVFCILFLMGKAEKKE